jgi:hypothetical protein
VKSWRPCSPANQTALVHTSSRASPSFDPSAWKGYFPKFAGTAFSKVRDGLMPKGQKRRPVAVFPGAVGMGVAPNPQPGEAYGIGAVPSEYLGTKRGRGFA